MHKAELPPPELGVCCVALVLEMVLFFILNYFFRAPLWHTEVPRLGVEWELLLPAYTTATATRDLSHTCDLHR